MDKQGLGEKAGGSLTIKCKDLKVIRVDIMNNEEFASVVDSIEKLSAIGEGTNIRAIKKFYYKNVMLDLQSLVLPKYKPCDMLFLKKGSCCFELNPNRKKIMICLLTPVSMHVLLDTLKDCDYS